MSEIGGKQVVKLIKKKRSKSKNITKKYQFTADGNGDKGLKLKKDDSFVVAAKDGEVIFIEKDNDDSNPYFVDLNWLESVSNYERQPSNLNNLN